jgi:Glutathione S-transferase, N-terminal domain
MIDLHYWTTPNGHKIAIFLEESGLPYRIVPVNISKGDQFKPEFLAISPNNRIPAIVDHESKGGGAPDLSLRVRGNPALSCRKDREVHPERHSRPGRGAAMAVLAGGRLGSDGGPEPSLRPVRA